MWLLCILHPLHPPLPSAVDENGLDDGLLPEPLPHPIVKMAVAPNGRFLACFSRDGMLAVVSSTFAPKVRHPRQLNVRRVSVL